MSNSLNFLIRITGVVQSVGFRPFIKNLADEMKLTGSVQNLSSAGVEIRVQSTHEKLNAFIDAIREKKPPLSEIFELTSKQISNGIDSTAGFIIKKSRTLESENQFSTLPPDIAICSACQSDIQSNFRRHEYPFTSCTNCGPRYTTIKNVPYDRINTTFDRFELCPDCTVEYQDPANRRFHAQTTCCKNCGPKYTLMKNELEFIDVKFSWMDIRKLLGEGKILAVQGLGGSHFITDAFNPDSVVRLRQKRRKNSNKPFAIMMNNLAQISKFFSFTEAEGALLTSLRRPIVVLNSKNPELWQPVNGGLSTVGVMLPYSGLHQLLFDEDVKALVMTSANLPGIPMPIDSQSLTYASKQIADYVLVHNWKIHQRIDDSVVRLINDTQRIMRRSRGFTPQPFYLPQLRQMGTMMGMGAEENLVISALKDGWVIPSQHIGNLRNIETLEFAEQVIHHLDSLFHINSQIFLSDLHPEFLTTKYAATQANLPETQHHKVQHHVAHVASLSLDNHLGLEEPILAWACDGYGYGEDGSAWGGELLLLENGNFKRLATIMPVDYSGADQNAKYPARMLLRYLISQGIEPDRFFESNPERFFKHGETEYEFLKHSKPIEFPHQTHSIGRFFDAISVMLDISALRTYQGEPAIKLEDYALNRKEDVSLGNIDRFINQYNHLPAIDTPKIVAELYELYNHQNKATIANMSFKIMAKLLFEIGSNIANDLDIDHLGFTGGIAYNQIMTNTLSALSENKIQMLYHKAIPPGDGGISSGQIYYWSMKKHYE